MSRVDHYSGHFPFTYFIWCFLSVIYFFHSFDREDFVDWMMHNSLDLLSAFLLLFQWLICNIHDYILLITLSWKILSLLFTFLLKVLCFLLFASLFIFNSYHNFHNYDITRLLSRGEICVANFIPPANGASLGSFLCSKFKLG